MANGSKREFIKDDMMIVALHGGLSPSIDSLDQV